MRQKKTTKTLKSHCSLKCLRGFSQFNVFHENKSCFHVLDTADVATEIQSIFLSVPFFDLPGKSSFVKHPPNTSPKGYTLFFYELFISLQIDAFRAE